MRFDFEPVPAIFLARPNRYLVHARLNSGAVVAAHCADPGRLRELLLPGAALYLSAARLPGLSPRKTQWDLRFVEHPETGQLVSLDTRVPNAVAEEGLRAGFFPELAPLLGLRREVALPAGLLPHGAGPRSRFDFLLAHPGGGETWLEVKSASLVVDRVALFPDAVTARGARHLLELAALARAGLRAAVLFVVQRPDADALEAHRATDPAFADALARARACGVALLAARCRLTLREISLDRAIEVRAS